MSYMRRNSCAQKSGLAPKRRVEELQRLSWSAASPAVLEGNRGRRVAAAPSASALTEVPSQRPPPTSRCLLFRLLPLLLLLLLLNARHSNMMERVEQKVAAQSLEACARHLRAFRPVPCCEPSVAWPQQLKVRA